MSYTYPEDVETILMRTLTDEEYAATEVAIEELELLIKQEIPLAFHIQRGWTSARMVALIVARMVAAQIRNPEGINYEQDGDYAYTLAAGTAAGGDLWLSDLNWRKLGKRGNTAFTIRPGEPYTPATRWYGEIYTDGN